MPKIDDYINILNLGKNFRSLSQEEQIKTLAKAWRDFSLKWHPDRNKSLEAEEIFKKGNNANDKLKEYIKSGYFSDEETESGDDEYSTDDAYKEYDFETYYRTETEHDSDINSQFWEKYSTIQEKKLFFESTTPIKIIITALIISFAWLVITEFKTTENTNQPKQERMTDEINNTQISSSYNKNDADFKVENEFEDKISEEENPDNKTDTTNDGIDFGPYMRRMESRIKKNWNPPRGDASNKVIMLFTIDRDGRLISIKTLQSSGSPENDRAAKAAIEITAPFEPLPPEYKKNSADIEFTFDYNVVRDKSTTKY